MKKIAIAGALAFFASSASAVTLLSSADAVENGGGAIDIFADTYQFQDTFAAGDAGPLTFTFENATSSSATIVVSSASILQSKLAFFTGGASVDWTGLGANVAAAGQGDSAGGGLTFTIGANTTEDLVLTFGAAVENLGQRPDIDFFVSAVPLPAGALLMGTALAGFGVAARKKRKS